MHVCIAFLIRSFFDVTICNQEGGFFVETFRSGTIPMSTMGQTGYGCPNPDNDLITTKGRTQNRPDNNDQRNSLTSIYWVPTLKSPMLLISRHCSDHVHYYHGGKPFKYILYDPESGILTEEILGCEFDKGHKLQVCVRAGIWKCGHILTDEDNDDMFEYSLIGEAVAPGTFKRCA
jgi:predicted cupin superfamily sugar epimerase